MRISEVMTRGVQCVKPGDSLRDAAKKMRDLDVGPVPVCGDNDKLAGMLTDRDIAIRAVAEGKDPNSTKVQDVMTPDIHYCFEDQDVEEAAKQMRDRQIRRLVVLNRDKRMVGIVSLGDLAVETSDEDMAGETLEAVSQSSKPKG
jgi:CBS domain-containing protein